ncbi:barstar family protein [Streptomyces sp. NPDC002467]|uniref:barstar family protein n=1 Tax=Streptomyces sp. NPDC002467 TaxID=3364647 RepID=UPI0036950310
MSPISPLSPSTSLEPLPLTPALDAAEKAGWTVMELDLDGVRGKAALMRRCQEALELPEWFGGNWDALADVLRDFSWLPQAPGRLVTLTSWRGCAEAGPDEWAKFVEILEGAVEFWQHAEPQDGAAAVPLTVLLAEGMPPRTPRLPPRRYKFMR